MLTAMKLLHTLIWTFLAVGIVALTIAGSEALTKGQHSGNIARRKFILMPLGECRQIRWRRLPVNLAILTL